MTLSSQGSVFGRLEASPGPSFTAPSALLGLPVLSKKLALSLLPTQTQQPLDTGE